MIVETLSVSLDSGVFVLVSLRGSELWKGSGILKSCDIFSQWTQARVRLGSKNEFLRLDICGWVFMCSRCVRLQF